MIRRSIKLALCLTCVLVLSSRADSAHGTLPSTTQSAATQSSNKRGGEQRRQTPAKADSEIDQMIRDATAEPETRPGLSPQSAPAARFASDQDKSAEASSVLELLFYPFLACLILTGIHCYLGIHVIARGVIFVDLALAQMAALGGVLVLHLPGIDPHGSEAYGLSLVATLLGAALFATGRLKKQVVPQEAIIGIIYAVSSALALLLLSKAPSEQAEETKHMLVGRLLFVSKAEVWKTAALYAVVGLFHWMFRRRFLAISLQPELAEEQGVAVRWWDFLFYTSFGVVVTSSVQMAGILVVFSFLIVPAVCATLLAQRISTRLFVGWAVGFVASVLGLSLSAMYDFPSGESVVTTFGGLLVLVALVRWLVPRLGSSR